MDAVAGAAATGVPHADAGMAVAVAVVEVAATAVVVAAAAVAAACGSQASGFARGALTLRASVRSPERGQRGRECAGGATPGTSA
jgi:hypothetical protein